MTAAIPTRINRGLARKRGFVVTCFACKTGARPCEDEGDDCRVCLAPVSWARCDANGYPVRMTDGDRQMLDDLRRSPRAIPWVARAPEIPRDPRSARLVPVPTARIAVVTVAAATGVVLLKPWLTGQRSVQDTRSTTATRAAASGDAGVEQASASTPPPRGESALAAKLPRAVPVTPAPPSRLSPAFRESVAGTARLAKELGDKLVEYQRLTERSSAILRQYGELEREIQRERESIEERLQRRGAAHANLDAPSAPDVQELKRKVDEKRFALGQAIESDTSVYEGRIEALAKDPDFAAVERSVVEAEARTALLANPELAPFIELIVMHAISFRVTGHAARESWRADLRSRAQPQTRDYEAIG